MVGDAEIMSRTSCQSGLQQSHVLSMMPPVQLTLFWKQTMPRVRRFFHGALLLSLTNATPSLAEEKTGAGALPPFEQALQKTLDQSLDAKRAVIIKHQAEVDRDLIDYDRYPR